MPVPPLSSTSPLDWRYVAEGGANLVLSFCSQPDSPYAGHALRLRKRKKRSCGRDEHDEVPAEVDVEFGRIVVEPLSGQAQLPETVQVELGRAWLEQLVERMKQEGVRPAEREEEDEVDLDAKNGVVVEDLISGEGVPAIEIKPKWGFLPSPAHLSPSTVPLKTMYCRFCMHRYYKRVLSSASSPEDRSTALAAHEGEYCPLDLYSSDSEQVERALRLRSTVDAHDIEGLAALLKLKTGVDITFALADLSRLGPQPSMQEWRDWMEQFRSLFPSFPSSSSSTPNIAAAQQVFLSGNPRFAIFAYLLSATFKDCSLIVRLPLSPPPLSSSSLPTGSFSTAQPLPSVKAIDLDPKPIIRLAKYWRMD
ncbi:hypothetical protein JCM8547_004837 [Rhodosporidiobolus lusitaniae]